MVSTDITRLHMYTRPHALARCRSTSLRAGVSDAAQQKNSALASLGAVASMAVPAGCSHLHVALSQAEYKLQLQTFYVD